MNKFVLFLFGIILIGFVSAECFPNYECGEWSACEDDLSTRICVDTKCGGDDIIERMFCGGADCEAQIECGEWSSCNYFDKTNDILEEQLTFEGFKERVCYDRAKCIDSFVETEGCSLSVPVKVKKTEWCGEELVEIFDDKGNVVGRVQETAVSKRFNRVDISFIRETSKDYCNYCFDGEKNFDETDTDCGGPSCPECIPVIEFFDWAFIAAMLSWGIFGLLFISGLVVISKSENFSEGVKNIFVFFKPLSREEALEREEKIKQFVTQKKISSEGYKNY